MYDKKECDRKYYQRNKNRINEKAKKRYQKKTDEIKIYKKEWYMKNKKEILEKRKKRNQIHGAELRSINRTILAGLKINGCAKCGYCNRGNSNDYIGALDFHHVNPVDKEFQLVASSMVLKNERIVNELNKCILLCNRCHQEIHHKSHLKANFKIPFKVSITPVDSHFSG